MTYPRACPVCAIEFGDFGPGGATPRHVTVWRKDGGTPSPWRPELPGRILGIKCLGCGSVFSWDYFGLREGDRRGRLVHIERDETGESQVPGSRSQVGPGNPGL